MVLCLFYYLITFHNLIATFYAFQGDPWWNSDHHVSSPESAEGSDSEETDDDDEEESEEEVEGTTSKPFINT